MLLSIGFVLLFLRIDTKNSEQYRYKSRTKKHKTKIKIQQQTKRNIVTKDREKEREAKRELTFAGTRYPDKTTSSSNIRLLSVTVGVTLMGKQITLSYKFESSHSGFVIERSQGSTSSYEHSDFSDCTRASITIQSNHIHIAKKARFLGTESVYITWLLKKQTNKQNKTKTSKQTNIIPHAFLETSF